MIKKVKLTNFKNVSHFETELDQINILIGANNSGKSSVLQGIHFSITSEVIRRKLGKTNIAEDSLLYLPSSNFLFLRHNQPYTVSTGLTSTLRLENEESESFSIEIKKGRNDNNISVTPTNNNNFRQQVTTFSSLYSMYVPGISGIPTKEKFITKAELRSAVARGDANMYIRNILYYLNLDNKLDILNKKIHTVFPDITITVPYNPDEDIYVLVNILINTSDNLTAEVPLEQCGTGMLQVIQIVAYALYFSPQLLLLDEPDEHLHPDNQMMLSKVLIDMATSNSIQIILCTHSRHLLTSLGDDSNIIWMKDGKILEKNKSLYKYDILLDIGALDKFDECIGGRYSTILLTEDSDTRMCELLLNHSGFTNTLIFPFKGCGNIETAILLANFIHQQAPDCKIIIHRDRDFMLENEVTHIKNKLEENNIIPFITDLSDIEAYFVTPNHLSTLLSQSVETISDWIHTLIENNKVKITMDFTNKRSELKRLPIYTRKSKPELWPSTETLLNDNLLITADKVKGKFLKKKILGDMYSKFNTNIDIIQDSVFLDAPSLKEISDKLKNQKKNCNIY